ncbi:type II secretion system protein N [Alloalcanivorax mobilis]|uniref:type II secretion system protein N n=1 Tax=Alloalcanivorax mobilis TaxID=2019569 RepID=UPI000C770017|nr:type II secretion system protein N [Alloalcanivorax mobilis]
MSLHIAKKIKIIFLCRDFSLIAVTIFFAYLIASNFWFFWSGPAEANIPNRSLPSSHQILTSEARSISEKEIRSWNIFGAYSMASTDAEAENTAPETNLSFKLLGVFENLTAKFSSAIISVGDKDIDLYRPGEDLERGIALKSVYGDRVVIDNKGRLETLYLVSFDSLPGVSISDTRKTHQEQTNSPQEEKTLTGRENVLQKYGLKPVSTSSAEGYIVQEDAKDLKENFGLATGDIIKSANGFPIGTDDSDVLAMKSFQDSGSATIVIDRKGQQIIVNYSK